VSTAALIEPAAILPGWGQRLTARRTAGAMAREIVVDIFAGAGGASLGIEAALGVSVDVAVNHSPLMIEMHEANHPATRHLRGDVWDYKPREVVQGRPVGLLWASPDCRHFSRAKGGVPVSPKVRALAWVVVRWAREVAPRVIVLENVPEFKTWGPLSADGKPDKARAGETFRRWKKALERAGYAVEHRELVAADYGVPTTRKRFFLIARRDGLPIAWPSQTHAPRAKAAGLRMKPWRAAAECIEWDRPCRSIFERPKPLADATLRRIATGIRRYVIDAAEPFIVTCNHGGPGTGLRSAAEPMRTVTGSRDAHGIVAPYLVGAGGPAYSGKPTHLSAPLGTLTAENHRALVAPTLVSIAQYRDGRDPAGDASEPLSTITANPKGGHHAVVSAFLAQFNTNPSGTVNAGHEAGEPLSTIASRGPHQALVAACLETFRGTGHGGDAREPMPALTAGGNHVAEVRAFLIAYYGNSKGDSGGNVREPLSTVVSRERFGLVQVPGAGEFQIADIGLRMLAPRELLRAQFGRFAADYLLIGTQAQQVAGIGNSVPPELAELLVAANVRLAVVGRSAGGVA
jgi:DNA (cytosine-5)-methyltransferase 1